MGVGLGLRIVTRRCRDREGDIVKVPLLRATGKNLRCRLGLALAIGVAAIVAATVAGTGGFSAFSGGTTTAESRRIVILADGTDWPIAISDLESWGAVSVSSWDELVRNVDSSTKAIIITKDALSLADRDWVRARVAEGIVLGALGVSSDALASHFGLLRPPATPPGDYVPPLLDGSSFGGDPYFALLYDFVTPTHASQGAMTERFLSTDQFLLHADRYIRRIESR